MSTYNDEEILNFCQLTGADADVALHYLDACGGNLDTGVNMYLEANGSAPDTMTSFTETMPPSIGPQDIPRLMPRNEVLVDDMDMQFGGFPFPGAGDNMIMDRANMHALQNFANGIDAEDTPTGRKLAALFSPPFEIIFKGSLPQAQEVAKREGKWLLVNVQERTEFACQVLNRDIWSDSKLKEFIKTQFIFLQLVSNSADGRRYASFYPFSGYPHIAIIDPRTGERVHSYDKIESPQELQHSLKEFVSANSLTDFSPSKSSPQKKNPEFKKKLENMSEEEQLELAMNASIAETKTAPAVAEIPVTEPQEPPASTKTTRIQLRFPDGKRVVRRFLKQSPINELFQYVHWLLREQKPENLELLLHRDQLSSKQTRTLEDEKILDSTINVSY